MLGKSDKKGKKKNYLNILSNKCYMKIREKRKRFYITIMLRKVFSWFREH